MKTKRSREIVARYQREWDGEERRTMEWTGTVSGSPQDVFPLLCPCREADWIPGWDARLIHSESGYAELGCVFQTDATGVAGPGVWVFSEYEEPRLVELVRFTPEMLIQIRISLAKEGSDRTSVTWDYAVTALSRAGRDQVDGMVAELPRRVEGLTLALDHYLRTGELIPLNGSVQHG